METTKFFSVIVPVLNEAVGLPGFLDMFAAQTYRDFELIFVDGSSEDDTQKIIRNYHSWFPIALVTTTTRSPGFQRNLGAEKSHGIYVVFFDADTVVEANFLQEMQTKLAKDTPDFASTRFVPDTSNVFDHFISHLANIGMIISTRCKFPFMVASNLFFKHEVFSAIGGFDPTVIISDDHEVVQRAAKKGYWGKIYYNPTHIFSFRRFEREGRLTVIAKYTKAFWYMLRYGPIRKQIYTYEMGGGVKK